jgi:hypothetical protein
MNPEPGTTRRFGFMVLVVSLLAIFGMFLVFRLALVNWRVLSDGRPARNSAARSEIQKWVATRGSDTRILCYGDVRAYPFQPGTWAEVIIIEPEQDGGSPFHRYRLSFDVDGKFVDAVKCPWQ